MLKTIFTATALILAVSSASFAAKKEGKCHEAKADWKSKEELMQKLEGEGMKNVKIKTSKGCYAVSTGKKGHHAMYNPKTLESVK